MPKSYVHALLGHEHTSQQLSTETTVSAGQWHDCEFEKFNKPLVFSQQGALFEGLLSFEWQDVFYNIEKPQFLGARKKCTSLRGPPADRI